MAIEMSTADPYMPPLIGLHPDGARALSIGIVDQSAKDVITGLVFYHKLGVAPTRERLSEDLARMYKGRWGNRTNTKFQITHNMEDALNFFESDWCGALTGFASPNWMKTRCVAMANDEIKKWFLTKKHKIYTPKDVTEMIVTGKKFFEPMAYWREQGYEKKRGEKCYRLCLYSYRRGELKLIKKCLWLKEQMKEKEE